MCERAVDSNAAAVIMAAQGKSRIKEFFVGSVTNYCLHRSKVPVIVFRAPHGDGKKPDTPDARYTSCESGEYEHIPVDNVTFCSPPSPASPPPLPPPLVPTLPCFLGLPTSGTLSYPNEESVSVLPTVNSLGIDIISGELGGGYVGGGGQV